MNTQNISHALQWRYATKAFDASKKIPDDQLHAVLEALRLAPSSYGLQPWKFVVVENPEVRAKLRASAWDQPQITDASHLVVLCATDHMTEEDITRFVEKTAEVQGVSVDVLSGYKDMMKGSLLSRTEEARLDWMKKQVYIALGFGLLTAAVLEIDACPMEGFDNAKFDEILGLKEKGLTSAVLLTLGYRSSDDSASARKKVRYDEGEVIVRV